MSDQQLREPVVDLLQRYADMSDENSEFHADMLWLAEHFAALLSQVETLTEAVLPWWPPEKHGLVLPPKIREALAAVAVVQEPPKQEYERCPCGVWETPDWQRVSPCRREDCPLGVVREPVVVPVEKQP